MAGWLAVTPADGRPRPQVKEGAGEPLPLPLPLASSKQQAARADLLARPSAAALPPVQVFKAEDSDYWHGNPRPQQPPPQQATRRHGRRMQQQTVILPPRVEAFEGRCWLCVRRPLLR